ncbi:hypothetical protein K435DRAFT_968111 [Dendrothele bispora CBS 962.96]|uniref:Uncharacterized protein n=1 Tax=Dendrothele bispora (strain CBS 962.96) TaxID=1314807 RepID=A0A4V4HEL2_DENBC|nr:hypothetical protein K435DRAFT_968111 [Dendrothele bispora CBS 962.96]
MRMLSVQTIAAVLLATITFVNAAPAPVPQTEVTRTAVVGTRTILIPAPSPSCRDVNPPNKREPDAEAIRPPICAN